MSNIEHPFAKVYRAVLKEKYLDKEAAIPDSSSLAVNDMPEDVMDESLKRHYAGKRIILSPRIYTEPVDAAQKQKMKRTITYV
jgi:hypothetical protein